MTRIITGAQSRAARAALGWTQEQLAHKSDVARKTVSDFEGGRRTLHRRLQTRIAEAFNGSGVRFVSSGDGEGVLFIGQAVSRAAAAAGVEPDAPGR